MALYSPPHPLAYTKTPILIVSIPQIIVVYAFF